MPSIGVRSRVCTCAVRVRTPGAESWPHRVPMPPAKSCETCENPTLCRRAMPMTDYDVVLVGGGHNGLVCAHALAKSGKRVLVLESAAQAGGCAATREFAPGFSVSSCAQWLTQLSPEVIKNMNLERHGLAYAARDLASVSLAEDGDHLVLQDGTLSGAGISQQDVAAYRDFDARMQRFSGLLAKAFSVRAPRLVESNFADRLTLIKLGLGLKLLGKNDMNDIMRIILINMYDVMQENFDHPRLKALLALDGMLGSHMGPRSPNTVFGYLYRRVGDLFGFHGPAQVRGGMGALAGAMVASCEAAGVEVRTAAAVSRIDTEAGRATGVTLASGERISAGLVVSNVTNRRLKPLADAGISTVAGSMGFGAFVRCQITPNMSAKKIGTIKKGRRERLVVLGCWLVSFMLS